MRLANRYRWFYGLVAGAPPSLRPWHFQWLAVVYLRADLRRVLGDQTGKILDVGCGEKPYEHWMPRRDEYVGLDITAAPTVDVVVAPEERWPLAADSFDVVICTQVLEHDAAPLHTLAEMHRVLRPGGTLLVTLPFMYGEHDAPADYWRFSAHGAESLLRGRYAIVEVSREGAIGSTLGILFLTWLESALTRRRGGAIVLMALLPLWLLLASLVNVCSWLIDRIDPSNGFYGNVLVLAQKRGTSGSVDPEGQTRPEDKEEETEHRHNERRLDARR